MDEVFKLSLTVREINTIMQCLQQQPWVAVNQVIMGIDAQVQAQRMGPSIGPGEPIKTTVTGGEGEFIPNDYSADKA